MLVRYFSNINNIKFVPALVLLLLLYAPSVNQFETLHLSENIFFNGYFTLHIPVVLYVIYYVLTIFFIGTRLHNHKLLAYPSYTHALFGAMLFSMFFSLEHLRFTQLLAYSLILYTILASFNLPDAWNKQFQFFKISLCTGLLVFLGIPYAVFILYPFVIMITFREITIKNLLSILNGLLLPHIFYVAAILILFGGFNNNLYAHFFHSLTTIRIDTDVFSLFLIIILLLKVILVIRLIHTFSRHKILFRKHTVNLIWASLLCVLIILTDSELEQQAAYMILSLVTGYLLAQTVSSFSAKRMKQWLNVTITVSYLILVVYGFFKIM